MVWKYGIILLATFTSYSTPAPQHSWPDWVLDPDNPSCSSTNPGYNASQVMNVALKLSTHSWEFGTAAEALLELFSLSASVFSPSAFPNDLVPSLSPSSPSLAYAASHIRLDNATLVDGDGANGDPASLGVSAILLSNANPPLNGNESETYAAAAHRQAAHILSAPRLSNGAISHRDTSTQAWSDFIFMAPPFLAYHAVWTKNLTLLSSTVTQCGLYRALLQYAPTTPPGTFWRHILDESPTKDTNISIADPGVWSTGNGWAAMGMARVLATIKHYAPAARLLEREQADLTRWIGEIVDGAVAAGTEPGSGLLRNYLNNETWFGEMSGSALLAATVYRMAVLEPAVFGGRGYIAWAEGLRRSVAVHVTANGTVSPAVNPLGWGDLRPWTAGSPEGQSFVAMLAAAYRDWVCSRRTTATEEMGGKLGREK